jgi:hypothetical protein
MRPSRREELLSNCWYSFYASRIRWRSGSHLIGAPSLRSRASPAASNFGFASTMKKSEKTLRFRCAMRQAESGSASRNGWVCFTLARPVPPKGSMYVRWLVARGLLAHRPRCFNVPLDSPVFLFRYPIHWKHTYLSQHQEFRSRIHYQRCLGLRLGKRARRSCRCHSIRSDKAGG